MGRKELSLEAVNQRLQSANIPVKVRQHGRTLALRAKLPPRPGSKLKEPDHGYYGLPAFVNIVQQAGLGYLLQGRDYQILPYPSVQAKLLRTSPQMWEHPETKRPDRVRCWSWAVWTIPGQAICKSTHECG
ncbi:MAG: hypothetical protein JO235_01250 [Chroococcidiopsidaceae cyanobacterium CP_BM_RX_35]|nr:hypothetical protein [Chroococcidiopsidaceae cyanobacterium CP_BM_RX_35]